MNKYTGNLASLLIASLVPVLESSDGGGGESIGPPAVVHANRGTVIMRSPLARGAQCANGGATINYGIDDNGDGTLDPSEIDGSEVICNGSSGLTGLISTSTLSPGEANCAGGGVRINIGVDTNGNNLLESSEITNSSTVVCHGINAATRMISDVDLERLTTDTTVRIEVVGTEVKGPGESGAFLSNGSGFFISEDGLIATNNHVVAGASQINVFNYKGELVDSASVVGVAECADLAVLKLQNAAVKRKYLSWSNSPFTRGLDVVAAGYPADVTDKYANAQFTYTKGGVTSVPLAQGMPWGYVDAFTHDAQIYFGSSGGPLVDANTGKVIGVNYMITRSASTFATSRFYSISAEIAKSYSERLSKGENIHSIGIDGEISFDTWGYPKGVFTKSVRSSGQAERSGLKPGDLITTINAAELFVRANALSGSEFNRPKFSMERYCGVLASNPPNNTSSVQDKGKELPIRVLRSDGFGQVCTGSINGAPLVCSNGDEEPNGTYASAQNIAIGQTVNGVIRKGVGRNVEYDIFSFVVTKEGNYRAKLSTNLLEDLDLYIFQASSSDFLKTGVQNDYGDEDLSIHLVPGTYYLVVDPKYASSLATEYSLELSVL